MLVFYLFDLYCWLFCDIDFFFLSCAPVELECAVVVGGLGRRIKRIFTIISSYISSCLFEWTILQILDEIYGVVKRQCHNYV